MRLHHVQVACPKGSEDEARRFYGDGLGMTEVEKPDDLKPRGGAWFRAYDGGTVTAEVHVGVEEPFAPALKAHPALQYGSVAELEAVAARLADLGFGVDWSQRHNHPGYERCHTFDGHGNRVELLAAAGAHAFDQDYWEEHWRRPHDQTGAAGDATAPNPHLAAEVAGLAPGTALDAGCGTGTESVWLASHGWQVTAVDISPTALRRAEERAADAGLSQRITWVAADLTGWTPDGDLFDLVATHYAHPAMPQLDFFDRLASWVAPGGTLLIVGHLRQGERPIHGEHPVHGEHPPAEATFVPEDVLARLDPATWELVVAEPRARTLPGAEGAPTTLQDVVIRAQRRGLDSTHSEETR